MEKIEKNKQNHKNKFLKKEKKTVIEEKKSTSPSSNSNSPISNMNKIKNKISKSPRNNKKIFENKQSSPKKSENIIQNSSQTIPSKIIERTLFLKNILTNDLLLKHVANSPPRGSSTYVDVANYLGSYSKNELELCALIFLWVTGQISYDATSFFSRNIPDQSAENTFKTGMSVCAGYANLFHAMCKVIGLKSEVVSGWAKGYGFKLEELKRDPNHAWNTVCVNNVWYHVDSTWGAGSLNSEKKFQKSFSPYYFLPKPELLINTHLAKVDKWQLLSGTPSHKQLISRTTTMKQFESKKVYDYATFYNALFDYNIEFITHPDPFINLNEKKLQIKICAKNLDLIAEFEGKPDGCTVNRTAETITSVFTFDLNIEKNGEYKLIIFRKKDADKEGNISYISLLYYHISLNLILIKKKIRSLSPKKKKEKRGSLINNRSIDRLNSSQDILESDQSDSLITPLKPKCYDNQNTYLYEPKNINLKIGQTVKFKVKVKGATSVAVLDFKQFHFLKKRGEDIWEGSVTIKTVYVTIVSQKSSSLFTEIYEFTNIK
jgi:hypothetical protein